MVKAWVFKGPLMFFAVALVSFPLMADLWTSMSRGTVVFVLLAGPLFAIPVFMPTPVKGTD